MEIRNIDPAVATDTADTPIIDAKAQPTRAASIKARSDRPDCNGASSTSITVMDTTW